MVVIIHFWDSATLYRVNVEDLLANCFSISILSVLYESITDGLPVQNIIQNILPLLPLPLDARSSIFDGKELGGIKDSRGGFCYVHCMYLLFLCI